jgi:uncharacterized protein
MKYSKIIIVVVIFSLVGIVLYSLSTGGSSEEEYKAAILLERTEKDAFMKNSEESPFNQRDTTKNENQVEFTGLKYFEVDPKYRINATLKPIDDKKVVVLATSSGDANRYLEYAWAEFEWEGINNSLLILEVMDMGPSRGKLFLAFADETSAHETYGAGRYLDLKKVAGASTVVLDFNTAYNPYCAYNSDFTCPLPPKENILKVAIRAGEKNYH